MAVFRRREWMVGRRPAVRFFVVLEHREVDHPQWLPHVFEQAGFLAEFAVTDFHAQRADGVVDDLGLVRAEEDQVAVLRARLLEDRGQHVGRQELDDRRLQAFRTLGFLVDLDVSEALGAVDGDELGVGIDFRTGHAAALRYAQGNHAAAFHVGGAVEDLELDRFHDFRQVREGQLDAHVRLVGTVQAHRFGEIHHRERVRQVDVQRVLEDDADHVFEQVADFLFRQERGFAIDLREFRLAVSAQVFVAEALGDLVVTVEVSNHQQLLEQLWRLRQGEEAARVDARRHQVIARAFWRRLGQHRRFDVDEAQRVEVLAHFHRHFVTQAQVVLHLRAAQVQHAVRQTRRFRQVVVVQLERHGHGRVQHFQLRADHFDLARLQVVVDRAFDTVGHDARHAQAEFVAHGFGDLEHFRLFRVADDLHQAFTVAQVDENQAAVVAAAMYPAAQADGLSQHGFGNEAAVFSTHRHKILSSG
ncbi:hypothetical protein D3C87_408080 [compost metagenome]